MTVYNVSNVTCTDKLFMNNHLNLKNPTVQKSALAFCFGFPVCIHCGLVSESSEIHCPPPAQQRGKASKQSKEWTADF